MYKCNSILSDIDSQVILVVTTVYTIANLCKNVKNKLISLKLISTKTKIFLYECFAVEIMNYQNVYNDVSVEYFAIMQQMIFHVVIFVCFCLGRQGSTRQFKEY